MRRTHSLLRAPCPGLRLAAPSLVPPTPTAAAAPHPTRRLAAAAAAADPAILLHDVTPRDGLQNEEAILTTESKLALIEKLLAANPTSVEVTSFVRADLIPALADASELCKRLADAEWAARARAEGVRFAGLVPNMRGYETLREHRDALDTVCVLTSSTDSHSKANVNRTIAEALEATCAVITQARSEGFTVQAYVSMCFGCPFEGEVDPAVVQDIVQAYAEVDADMIVICDTLGIGYPEQADVLLGNAIESGVPVETLALHIHDTHVRPPSLLPSQPVCKLRNLRTCSLAGLLTLNFSRPSGLRNPPVLQRS